MSGMEKLLGHHAVVLYGKQYIYIQTPAGNLALFTTNKRGVKCRRCGARIEPGRGIRLSDGDDSGFLCYDDFRLFVLKHGHEHGYREDVRGNLAVGMDFPGTLPTYAETEVARALWRQDEAGAVYVEAQ